MKPTQQSMQITTKVKAINGGCLQYFRTIRFGGGRSLDNKHNWDTYMINGKIRRLTPTECERLMSWPESVFYVKMELCLDQVKNYANAVIKNPRLQKYVGRAEHANIPAWFVEKIPMTNFVQEGVITNGKKEERNGIQKETSSAGSVERSRGLGHQKIKGISVQYNVGINLTEGQTINNGLAELQVSGVEQILQQNGKNVLNLSGNEIMQLVEDAGKNLVINPIKSFMSITLLDSKIEIQDLMSVIFYWFVNSATDGYMEEKISTKNLSLLFRITNCGWTKYGINEKGEKVEISDSQRYKMCGNGVVSKVVEEVFKNIICKK